jgi:hypothetical protein
LNDPLVRFEGQFELGAQSLGAFALATGFAIQCGARQFDAGEVFEHGAGIRDRHFAGQECRHILHGGRIAGGLFQAQGGVGGHAPFVAAFAVTPGALDGDRTPARLKGARVFGRQAAERLSAHRTDRRRGVSLGLSAALDGLAEPFLDVASGLDFQMAEVLIAGLDKALNRTFQRARRPGGLYRQRFGRWIAK